MTSSASSSSISRLRWAGSHSLNVRSVVRFGVWVGTSVRTGVRRAAAAATPGARSSRNRELTSLRPAVTESIRTVRAPTSSESLSTRTARRCSRSVGESLERDLVFSGGAGLPNSWKVRVGWEDWRGAPTVSLQAGDLSSSGTSFGLAEPERVWGLGLGLPMPSASGTGRDIRA